jgi:hypothetical protein
MNDKRFKISFFTVMLLALGFSIFNLTGLSMADDEQTILGTTTALDSSNFDELYNKHGEKLFEERHLYDNYFCVEEPFNCVIVRRPAS